MMTDGLMLIGALRRGSDTTLSWNKDRCLNQFSRPKLLNMIKFESLIRPREPAISAASEPGLTGVIIAIVIG